MERAYTRAEWTANIQPARSLLNGNKEDLFRAFQILVDAAYTGDNNAFQVLGDCLFCGDFGTKDTVLAGYIFEILKGNRPRAISQYTREVQEISNPQEEKNRPSVTAIKKSEQQYLDRTLEVVEQAINNLQYRIGHNVSAYCLEMDVQSDLLSKHEEIEQLFRIKERPYYGRIDVDNGEKTASYYIGEQRFGEIVSVWSEFGKHFRAKQEGQFWVNGISYTVKLRRQIDIDCGQVISIDDLPIPKSADDTQQIYDPFLRKVLEEKRGETNVSNIIRSIQESQNRIIDFDFDKNLIVQGCAGSGKTMILLHRLANMKYNRPDMEWKHVKIITPNKVFNTYIDDISSNLGINMIKRCSLAEYYLLLIERYSRAIKGQFDAAQKGRNIVADANLDYEVTEYIYSKDFARTLKEAVLPYAEELRKKEREAAIKKDALSDPKNLPTDSQKELEDMKDDLKNLNASIAFQARLRNIESLIEGILQKRRLYVNSRKSYQCILYAKVLGLYFAHGEQAPPIKDTLLCIDEGQDISLLQYRLLQQVNGGKVRFNIYGDIHQTVPQLYGNSNWESLQKFIEELPEESKSTQVPLFSLQENYRNSQEIVEFYNHALKKTDRALGIQIKKNPRYIEIAEVATLCKFHLLLQNRVVIISNDFSVIPPEVNTLCTERTSRNEKVSIMTVIEAKGLEFDVAFIFEAGMTENEKYIAYTRSLSELYLIP